jgi:hypothetical protein
MVIPLINERRETNIVSYYTTEGNGKIQTIGLWLDV